MVESLLFDSAVWSKIVNLNGSRIARVWFLLHQNYASSNDSGYSTCKMFQKIIHKDLNTYLNHTGFFCQTYQDPQVVDPMESDLSLPALL
jgi:hypothetical protein